MSYVFFSKPTTSKFGVMSLNSDMTEFALRHVLNLPVFSYCQQYLQRGRGNVKLQEDGLISVVREPS